MGRGLLIGGIVLLVIGILLAVGTFVIQGTATSVTVPSGAADTLSAPSTSLGSASFSVSWSGAASSTTAYLTTGVPTCSGTPAGLVAQGSGASGSLSATLNSGTTYYLFACNGSSGETVTFSWTAMGISLLLIIGVIVAVLGIVLLALGMRRRKTVIPAAAPGATEGDVYTTETNPPPG